MAVPKINRPAEDRAVSFEMSALYKIFFTATGKTAETCHNMRKGMALM